MIKYLSKKIKDVEQMPGDHELYEKYGNMTLIEFSRVVGLGGTLSLKGSVKTYVIDLFCGAGGTHSAINEAKTNIEVISCINHDKNAVLSNLANFPDCLTYIEDIRTVDLHPLIELVNKLREEDPTCKIALWASLECINFSPAKCGPKDISSRSLADDMFRYLDAFNPDFFWVENVKQFRNWGPLDKNNTPIKSKIGQDYKRWVKRLTTDYFDKTYYDESLISADFEGRTIRDRLFLQFAKNKKAIGHPVKTHDKNEKDGLLPWLPIIDILDLDNVGNSIFNRRKPLVPKSNRRIGKGLVKYGPTKGCSFGIKYYGQLGFQDMKDPAATLTTKDRISPIYVTPLGIKQNYGASLMRSANDSSASLTVRPKSDVGFVHNLQYGGTNRSVNAPSATVIARQDKAPLGITVGVANKKENGLEFRQFLIRTPGSRDIWTEEEGVIIASYLTDDPWMRFVKRYMFFNNLVDVSMRSLEIPEMLSIQGFPDGYILIGTKTEQKKYIGNSVEIKVGMALIKSIDKAIQSTFA